MHSLVLLSRYSGWVNHLKPWLEDKLHNSWVDPRACKDEKELSYKYGQAYHFAMAVKEILEYVENAQSEYERLQKKDKGELKEFRI